MVQTPVTGHGVVASPWVYAQNPVRGGHLEAVVLESVQQAGLPGGTRRIRDAATASAFASSAFARSIGSAGSAASSCFLRRSTMLPASLPPAPDPAALGVAARAALRLRAARSRRRRATRSGVGRLGAPEYHPRRRTRARCCRNEATQFRPSSMQGPIELDSPFQTTSRRFVRTSAPRASRQRSSLLQGTHGLLS